jgi:sugar O-acyltransferase (sialic acid O-acetyltransferase NeuD family)
MTRRVVVVGAGEFGREIVGWVQTSPLWRATVEAGEITFVADDTPDDVAGISYAGSIADYDLLSDDIVLCAIGNPGVRVRIVAILEARGVRFTTFVHDRALLGPRVQLGHGSLICPDVVITTDVVVGSHVHINVRSVIGHDCVIGEFVTISPCCNLTGGVVVGEGAFLAASVSVAPGKRISAYSQVGIGSVVMRHIKGHQTVVGNPARVISGESE